jgi:hypothetical protein
VKLFQEVNPMDYIVRRPVSIIAATIVALTLSACAASDPQEVSGDAQGSTNSEGQTQEFKGSNGEGSLTIINYTHYSTDMIMEWAMSASDLMANQEANVLTLLYPVGQFTGEMVQFLSGAEFALHDVVMIPENQEALLGEVESWRWASPIRLLMERGSCHWSVS